MEPLYTSATVKAAYQLRWSLAVFAKRTLPSVDSWLFNLQQAVEQDGVRVLEVTPGDKNVLYFYLSTRPDVAPPGIVKSVKGRLQHALRATTSDAFRRNFLLTAVGEARVAVVEQYVASQLDHHRMADARVQSLLKAYQFEFPEVDLEERQLTAHGAYAYCVHLVLVNAGRRNEVREEALAKSRDMVLRVADRKQHRISRLSLLADHLHLVAGIPPTQAPEEVALGYMNNLVFAHGMQAVFCPSYYIGTVGAYDGGAVRAAVAASRGPTDAGSVETG